MTSKSALEIVFEKLRQIEQSKPCSAALEKAAARTICRRCPSPSALPWCPAPHCTQQLPKGALTSSRVELGELGTPGTTPHLEPSTTPRIALSLTSLPSRSGILRHQDRVRTFTTSIWGIPRTFFYPKSPFGLATVQVGDAAAVGSARSGLRGFASVLGSALPTLIAHHDFRCLREG